MKRLSFSLLLFLLLAISKAADAQSCTTAVCNAASPNESDVLAALPSSGNTNATVVVNIPSGTAGWTTQTNYTIPSAVTNLTIQGNTAVTCNGTAGTAGYSCSATDNTVIQDSNTGNAYLLQITTGGTSTYFRMTGLTIEGGSNGAPKGSGILDFWGSSHNLRLDHNHFNNNTYSPAINGNMLRIEQGNLGVLDHNLVDLGGNTSVAEGFDIFNPYDDSIGNGDGSWADSTGFGSANFIFIESNQFNGGLPQDCYVAGRYVMRYNYFNGAFVAIRDHGTKTPGGAVRGCRAFEAYHNYITGPGGNSTAYSPIGSEGAPALIWDNTEAAGYYRLFSGGAPRNNGSETETNTPNGWGYCGTAGNNNGVGSQWDGNKGGGGSPTTSGYPCLDGLGRGQTQQSLNGANFPNRLNSSTGSIAWPQQELEPIYFWMNTIPAGVTEITITDSSTNNQDYYYECGAANPGCSGSFTGSAGTGYGTLSARPSTCTPGQGGTYFTSPTGSYGVAYFATDANSGNGELYVCTSTNTWTAIYQPYVYPHPLVSGTPAASSNPQPPTGLVATVN
jgi:hypothetical protein